MTIFHNPARIPTPNPVLPPPFSLISLMNSSPSTLHIPTPRLSGLILNSASPPSRRRPSQRPGFVLLIAPNGECLCLQLLVLSASLHCLPGTREVYGGYCGPLMNAVALPARLLSLLPGSLFDAPGGPLCRKAHASPLSSVPYISHGVPVVFCVFLRGQPSQTPSPFSLLTVSPAPHGYCMAHPSRSL